MGFLSFIKKVGHAIGSTFTKIGNGVKDTFNSIKNTLSSSVNKVSSSISTVYGDVKKGISTAYTAQTNLLKSAEGDLIGKSGLLNNAIDKTTNILSMPLLIVAGGVGAFLLFSGKNSSATVSYNR